MAELNDGSITIKRGATFVMSITFTEADQTTPIDVSGWTFSGQIRKTYDATPILASFVFTAGTSTNIKIATISAANTELIPVDPAKSYKTQITNYTYDIKAVRGDGTTVRVVMGNANISPDVTKP